MVVTVLFITISLPNEKKFKEIVRFGLKQFVNLSLPGK